MKRFRPVEAKAVAFAMVQACRQGRPGVQVFESEEIREIFMKYGPDFAR
jgi:hypothetical protein